VNSKFPSPDLSSIRRRVG